MAEKVGGIYYDVTLDTGKMIDGTRIVDRELGSLKSKFTQVASAVSLLAVAMATLKSAEAADDLRLLGARVQVAAGSVRDGASAMAELEAISRRTQTSVEANSEVFTRLNSSIKAMGGTQADTLRLTETLGKAIKVSGASAVEAKAAMLQFGQALGSGKLAGDELRSLMETAPYLMRQMADAMGVPVGSLKKLGEEGKLTADVVAIAMQKASSSIEADFSKFPQTVSGAIAVMSDAAKRANKELDELTGTSTALTGASKGLGQVLDSLAVQFSNANAEGSNLSKNDQINSWADNTKTVLSYVVDAADLIVRGFRQMGTGIGGLAAAAAAAARGELTQSKDIISQMYADIVAIGNKPYAGQQIRDGVGAAPGAFVGPMPQSSKLTAPPGSGSVKKGLKFDSNAYLAGLNEKAVDGLQKVAIVEQEAKRKADELLKEGKITREQHEKAITLITADAETARVKIKADALKKAQEERDKFDSEQKGAIDMAAGVINGAKSEDEQIKAKYAAKKTALDEALAEELISEQLHAQAVVANQQSMNEALADMENQRVEKSQAAQLLMMQGGVQLFGSLADATKEFAGKQNAVYKTMFAASKAFAIAESIVKIQQGIAQAASLPFPINLGAMATVAASTASIISTIQSAQYGGGRQYGGPVSAGSLYRVNETGRPEMFTASNGSQYMMPTANGRVTPADQVGGGNTVVQVQVINQHPTAQVQTSMDQSGKVAQIVISEIAGQIRDNSGPVWSAMRSSTNVQGRL